MKHIPKETFAEELLEDEPKRAGNLKKIRHKIKEKIKGLFKK